MPNQDAVGSRLAADGDGAQVLLFAVADGHGDSRHFRSDRGARLAVAEALAAAAEWVQSLPPSPADAKTGASGVLIPDIVARWNAAVEDDILADPLGDTAGEPAARPAPLSSIAYGATLLVCVIAADYAAMTQIGDGDILAVRPDGTCLEPVPADPSLDGRRTTSICQPDAAAAFRVGVVDLAACPLFAVLAATDGYGNSQAAENWQHAVAADLVSLARAHGRDWVARALPGWAGQCASSEGSGDDCTVALAFNSELSLAVTEPRVPAEQARAEGRGTARLPGLIRQARHLAGRALTSRWVVACAVTLIVLAAIATGLLVSRHTGAGHHGKAPVHGPSAAPRGGTRPRPRPAPHGLRPAGKAASSPAATPRPIKRTGS